MKSAYRAERLLPRVLLRVLPPSALLLLGAWYLASLVTEHTVEDQVRARISLATSQAAKEVSDRIDTLVEATSALAENGLVVNSLVDMGEHKKYSGVFFQSLRIPGPPGARISLLDYRGRQIASNQPDVHGDHPDLMTTILRGQAHVSVGRAGVLIAVPVLYQGAPEGAVVVSYDDDRVAALLGVQQPGYDTAIKDDYDTVIYSSSIELALPGTGRLAVDPELWLQSEAPIPNHPTLRLVGAVRADTALGVVYETRTMMLLLIAFGLTVLSGGIILTAYLATNPLGHFVRALAGIAGGDTLHLRVEPFGPAEVRDLAASVNRMLDRIDSTTTSRDRVDNILNSMTEILIVTDADGIVQSANKAALTTLGYDHEEITRCHIAELLEDRQTGDGTSVIKPMLGQTGVLRAQTYCVSKTEEVIPVLVSVVHVAASGSERNSLIYVARDITDRKKVEEQLQERERQVTQRVQELEDAQQRHAAVLNTVVDGIITIDERGTIEAFNPAAERLFGYSSVDVVGRNVRDLMPSPDRECHDTYLQNYTRGGKKKIIGIGREVEGRRKDGSTFPIELAVSEMYVGEQRMFTGILRDITERKEGERQLREREEALQRQVLELEDSRIRLEEKGQELVNLAKDLELARDQAEAANRAKSDFLATMSHEIRTPMNAIIGMTDLLLEADLPTRQRKLAETVLTSAETLLDLINQILDFSKIEAGQIDLDSATFDLNSAVEDVLEVLAVRTREKELDSLLHYVPGTPRFVIGDNARIRQILYNLTGNAIKFTEHGYIQVTVETIGGPARADGKAIIKMSVKDTGIGIPRDKQAKVFERFAQADSSTTRRFGGTGLGLSICQQLIDLMGGEIGVESQEGQGSTFWITVPFEVDHSAVVVEPDRGALAGLKTLIVDDIEVNRVILNEQFSSEGMVCTSCDNGPAALDLLRRATAEGKPFQIAILDYHMPEMDGRQLSRAIKDDTQIGTAPIIILSSSGDNVDRQKFAEAGVAAFLAKPTRKAQLLDTIEAVVSEFRRGDGKVIASSHGAQPAEHSERAPQTGKDCFAGTRVLLAEDNRINREFAIEMLNDFGCEIEIAENGRIATEKARKGPYDIILMDCHMPEMDGFAASRIISEMKAKGEISEVPIIALTANAMKGDKERCLEAGMNDYLSKPVRKKALREMILQWLEARKEAKATMTMNSKDPAAFSADGPVVLDMDVVADARSAMKDKFATMIQYYLEDAASYIQQIQAALPAIETDKIVSPAHTLKSSSKQLGAMQMAEAARELEETARKVAEAGSSEGQDIAAMFQRLQDAFASAEPALTKVLEDLAA